MKTPRPARLKNSSNTIRSTLPSAEVSSSFIARVESGKVFRWKRPFLVVGERSAPGNTKEVRVHAEARLAALLGVELCGDNVVAGDNRCEVHAVIGLSNHDLSISGRGVIRMNEVEIRAVGYTLEYWVVLDDPHLVPAHVGDFKAV